VGAVNTLLAGQSSVLITRQEGQIVPIPFAEIIDPKTNKSRVRGVDVNSDSYRNALALQDRITAEDLADPETLAALAAAANLSPEESKLRYATS
jgi:6-phosphofructokinase 1